MIIAFFLLDNKAKKSRFFKKTFLLSNISTDKTLKILFLTLNNMVINFTNYELNWSLYITIEVLLTTKRVELFKKKELLIVSFNLANKIFIIYMAFLVRSDLNINIYLFCKA